MVWSAPNPNPIAIDMNRYANSSGSLIVVLKRTIERAPTSPNDKAKEDLTTVMIRMVVSNTNGQTCENSSLFERVEPNFLKWYLSTIDRITPIPRLMRRFVIDKGAVSGEGKHEELLISSNIYKNFYEKQIKRS